jgi:hypothetical protein
MGIRCGAYCCARKEDWLVFDRVCMVFLLENSIHLITSAVTSSRAGRSAPRFAAISPRL